jgi:serine protease Do
MEDILILDAVERYLRNEMSNEEQAYFEQLRTTNPEVDQLVVEHTIFLNQLETHKENKDFRHQLHQVHNDLLQTGDIKQPPMRQPGKVVQMWNKYKRMTGIAATIAGVTALVISGLFTYFSPGVPNKSDLRQLSKDLEQVKHTQRVQTSQINEIKSKVPIDARATHGGTSFLIDAKGYLVTSAHVVKGSSTILVQSNKGQQFKASIVLIDNDKDLAILKIDDSDFKPYTSLPYSIRKTSSDLGEPLFTLGFPRDEIVYNEGYLSAKTGDNGDTISCQITVSANPGNSGGPVLNKNGEVIGILSTSQAQAEGVVFAIKAKNIFAALDDLKKGDTSYARVKLPSSSNIRGLDRVAQIKQIEDCVFMVKGFAAR